MTTASTAAAAAPTQHFDALADAFTLAKRTLNTVILGQEQVIDLSLITLLSGGHAVLVGVPGLAKTKLVNALSVVLGLDSQRVQCTPDLMPADILGSEILDQAADGSRSFRFIPGPVFTRLLMADEINRASPRTQSALLQAMQEREVTIAGQTRALPHPFHVLATQNPLEQEGTYPLPEAQLDRFLMEITVDYPDERAEREMLIATTGALSQEPQPQQTTTPEALIDAQTLVRAMPVGDSVLAAILRLVRAARPTDAESAKRISWGPGPRAGQALMLAARARALLDGRPAPSLDDIAALAEPVLTHRMALTFEARAEGQTVAATIRQLVAKSL